MNSERRRRALITRPQEDAAAVAVALARRGITPVLAPMMQTEFFAVDIDSDLRGAQAVLFTSRNGVRGFSQISHRRDVPVFAVGDSTADLARENGFSNVRSAGGDSTDLARLVAENLTSADGPLIHVAGKTVAGYLSGNLSRDGFEVTRRTLYEAKPVRVLTAETAATIRNEEIDYVLFFSPRTARVFAELIAAAELTDHCRKFEAICLSEAVAAELSSEDWKVRRTAEEPTSEALLRTVDVATGGKAADTGDPQPANSPIPQSPFSKEEESPDDSSLPDDSDPVDLAPLQKAIQRATERAEAPRPGPAAIIPETEHPPAAAGDEDQAETDRPEELAETAMVASEEAPAADPVDPPTPSDDDDSPTPESSMTETDPWRTEQSARGKPLPEMPAVPAPPPARSRAPAVAWTLVVVFAAAIAGYVTLPMWRNKLPQYVQERLGGIQSGTIATDGRVTAELTDLRTQNDKLKAAIADLGKNLDASRARLTALDDLAARQSTGEKALEDLRAALKSAPSPEVPATDPALLARLDAVEKSLAGAVTAQSGQVAAGEKLDAGVAALTARIDAIESRVSDLQATVAELQKTSKSSGRGDALVLAVGQLRDALSRAAPFEAEIATLKKLAADKQAVAAAIAPVESLAATGVPSRAAVLSRLSGAVDAVVSSTRVPDGGDWVDRTVSKLQGFVSVRRVDGKGDGADAVLARAEAAAKRGDLAVTVAEMSKLDGKAAGAAKAWLTDAKARLAAESARAALNRIVLDGLATSG